MYTDTTLYYLDKIGIRPWIRRTLSDATNQDTLKLLIFKSASLESKSQLLLQQMMHYLDLSESEYSIISLSKGDSPNNYQTKIKQQTPSAIWIIGLDDINPDNVNCPVINSINPEHLIKNPKDKRKAFQQLQSIKQLIS